MSRDVQTLTLDILEVLADEIDKVNTGLPVEIGRVGENSSIAITTMPSTTVVEYMDGRKEIGFAVEIGVKNMKQSVCYNDSLKVAKHLEGLTDLPSKNNTYFFEDCNVTSSPHIVVVDERGYTTYSTSIVINIVVD